MPAVQHFPLALSESVFEKVAGLVVGNGGSFARVILDIRKSEIRARMFRKPIRQNGS